MFTRTSRRRALALRALGHLPVLWLLTGAASAQLSIELKYQEGRADPPSWDDPHARHLQRIVQDAAEYWEARFPDADLDLNVRFRWEDPTDVDVIPYLPPPGVAHTRRPYGAAAPNTYTIRFYSRWFGAEIDWFVDDEVRDDSEFRMVPIRYGSGGYPNSTVGLSSGGALHPLLEVGYEGQANRTFCDGAERPIAERWIAASPENGIDLYTVALRELGYAIGLGFRGEGEGGDGEYAISAGLVPPEVRDGGVNLATHEAAPGDFADDELAAPHSLFAAELEPGTRRLPSLLDLMVLAHINGFPGYDMERRYFDDTATHFHADSPEPWVGGAPGEDEIAVIAVPSSDSVVDVWENVSLSGLHLRSQHELRVEHSDLEVERFIDLHHHAMLMSQQGNVVTERFFHHGDLFSLDRGVLILGLSFEGSCGSRTEVKGENLAGADAEVRGPAAVWLLDGSRLETFFAKFTLRRLELHQSGAELEGGDALFEELEALVNDGLIRSQNGPLEFLPSGPRIRFDLDGDERIETGRIEALGGDITFGAPSQDDFAGSMRIGSGRTISVQGKLGVAGGIVELLGHDATLSIGDLDLVDGVVEAQGGGGAECFVLGDQTVRADGRLSISTQTRLFLAGNTTFDSETSSSLAATGAGTLVQVGDALVRGEETRIECYRYIWDGENPTLGAGYSTTTIEGGASLVITGDVSGGSWTDGFDGTVIVRGRLRVDQDWTLDPGARLVLEGGTVELGGDITNLGTIEGEGVVRTRIRNFGVVRCLGSGILFEQPVENNIGSSYDCP